MLGTIVDVLVAVMLVTGCVLALLAALGLHRFDDVFCRMHAATKPATLGLVLVAVAAGVALVPQHGAAKLALVVVLQFLTAPVGAHMVGRAAYRSGSPLSPKTVVDELGRPPEAEVYGSSR